MDTIINILVLLIPLLFGIIAIVKIKRAKLSWSELWQNMGFFPYSFPLLLTGIIIGATVFCLVFVVYYLTDLLSINGFSWTDANWFGSIFVFTIGAVLEEILFRSFFLSGMKQYLKSTTLMLVITAVFFSAAHMNNDGATILSSISAFVGGLMYGYAFIKTGKIWLPIGLHFAWNFFQGFVFGFNVSGYNIDGLIDTTISGNEIWTGGEYGPEGGLIGIGARIIVITTMWLILNKKLSTAKTD